MSKTNKVRTLSFRLAEDDYQKLVSSCCKAELSKSMVPSLPHPHSDRLR